MPWFLPWSETIKKSVTLNLIQRYLGQYLEHKLSVDQLSLDLYNGTGSLCDVTLDTEAVNSLIKQYNIPFEVIDGSLKEIFISVPWSKILSDHTKIVIKGLNISIQPSTRKENVSMFGSMVNSMTTSLQLAEECLRHGEPEDRKRTGIEGVEKFAQTIELVLAKIKIQLVDTTIRVEHVLKESQSGVAVEVKIHNIDYYDEAGLQKDAEEHLGSIDSSIFTVKRFTLQGVRVYTDEFPSVCRTFSRSMYSSMSSATDDGESTSPPNKLKESFHRQHSGMNLSLEPDPILVGELSGIQEIKLTMKRIHNSAGSLVDMEVSLGSFLVFCSPCQVYLLAGILKALQNPLLEDRSNIAVKSKIQDKPMGKSDFQKIEAMLSQQKSEKNSKSIFLSHGWSSPRDDESEVFHPLTSHKSTFMTEPYSSEAAGHEISLESSVYQEFFHPSNNEACREAPVTSQITIQMSMASCSIVLLHDNILIPAPEQKGILAKSSVFQMKKTSEDFFNCVGTDFHYECQRRNYNVAQEKLAKLCLKDQLRLFLSDIEVSYKCWESDDCVSLNSVIHVGNGLLTECLVKNEETYLYFDITEIVKFCEVGDEDMSIRIAHSSVEYKKTDHFCQSVLPKSELQIQLSKLEIEVDVTLVDRISALVKPYFEHSNRTNRGFVADVKSSSKPILWTFDFQLSFDDLRLLLRFPILDLRPISDRYHVKWWLKSLHKEILVLKFTSGLFSSQASSASLSTEVKLNFSQLILSLINKLGEPEVFLGKVTLACQADCSELQKPCIVFKQMLETPKAVFSSLDLNTPEDPVVKSMFGSMFNQSLPKPPTPFGNKKVIYSNVSPGSSATDNNDGDSGEEILAPGSREEMGNFIDYVLENSIYHIQMDFPSVELNLPNKLVYELLYNRLTVDLLLWEPVAWQTFYSEPMYGTNTEPATNLPSSLYEAFSMCRSATKFDPDGSDSETDESTPYYSLYECPKVLSTCKKSLSCLIPSRMAVSINFNMASIFTATPLRDSVYKVVPGYHGEILTKGSNGCLFCVSGYQGNVNDGFVLLWCESISAEHHAQVADPDCLGSPELCTRSHLLGRTPNAIQQLWKPKSNAQLETDALSLAIQFYLDGQSNSKVFKVALTVRDTTLQHIMYHPNQSWVEQLLDFVDVADYPIAGYAAPRVITQFYLHLKTCAMEYRPIHLPYVSVVLIDNLSVCSNIISQTQTSIIRLITEEAALFLSPACDKPKYVCVLSAGLFDLSVRLTENHLTKVKSMELNASNDSLHLWTCSDSCKAFAELLAYYASFGDLNTCDNSSGKSSVVSPDLETLGDMGAAAVSTAQVEIVHDLMKEAMKENFVMTSHDKEGKKPPRLKTARMNEFLFPNETSNKIKNTKKSPKVPCEQPKARHKKTGCHGDTDETPSTVDEKLCEALEESSNETTSSSNTDEDFCILEDDPGSGIKPRSGEPEVKILTDRPITVIDNFFPIPAGQVDLLKTPKHFPVPVSRFVLREINLVWHMYDGHDFNDLESSSSDDSRKTVRISSEPPSSSNANSSPSNSRPYKSSLKTTQPNFKVSYSVKETNENDQEDSSYVSFQQLSLETDAPAPRFRAFYLHGGSRRVNDACMELCLNKFRFSYDIYPETTLQAARLVFIINNFEIRDRLASSKFNKFLHLYSSPSLPRQSHANMLTVRAVLTRPDQSLPAQECSLRISLLPLKLNIDQDALFFFYAFFMRFSYGSLDKAEENIALRSANLTPPVMRMNTEDDLESGNLEWNNEEIQPMLMVLEVKDGESRKNCDRQEGYTTNMNEEDWSEIPIYFRPVIFSPDAQIVLDYHGKHIDLEHGRLAGILMGLGELKHSRLKLKRVEHRHGLLGVKKLMQYLVGEWAQDIRGNQMRGFLEGVGPMSEIVKFFQGVRDLFWLPVEQYQKDGRIVKGIQRGAHSFTTSTALAALEITNRLVQTIQSAAETAYDMISPGPSIRVRKQYSYKRKVGSSQPSDIREGVSNAVLLVREGLSDTAQAFVSTANREHEQKGMFGAVGSMLRQMPSSIGVMPVILASEATSNVLDGIRNQFAPETKTEEEEKWKVGRSS